MSSKFKIMRAASGYHPGRTKVEYEAPQLRHFGEMPMYETHERTIRELGPHTARRKPSIKRTCIERGIYDDGTPWEHFRSRPRSGTYRRIVKRIVTKILYAKDGKTPRWPKLQLVKLEVPGKLEGEQVLRPVTQLIPISAPVRLKQGSPKALYRTLKRLERTVGLDNVYAQMAKEVAG